ncbi:tight junction protein ZO-3 [Bifidobacterium longum subsp. longum]|uniref:Tight junction protein ZO-3 n=1 Tax=Bifidobacterium longum subsp. longum TaxID=1679 RepID=A0AA46JYZ0_BIFLL|nr:tight junction protein ZO-3 [Bifidobacterium longum]TPH36167.1 tight junction protein ZO-3 [Bifidobacterium longum subsp. longum]
MKRGSWSVESTIGLVFTIALAVIVAMVLAVIGLTAYAATNVAPEQTIVQKVETTGDVRRLCIEAKTGERVDAMSCDLIDPHTGGVAK